MFKGGDAGYVRFSTAAPVSAETKNMKPGMGVKLLRDGRDSANLVAMFSADSQESLNFFANDWSNHLAAPKSLMFQPLVSRFSTASKYIE